MTNLLFLICICIIPSIFLYKTRTQEITPNNEGELILSFYKGNKIIAIAGLYAIPAFAILELINGNKIAIIAWLLLWLFFSILSGWFYLILQNTKVIITPQGLTYISTFKKKVEMNWADIEKVKIRPIANLVYYSKNNKIKANFHLNGFVQFLLAKTIENLSQDLYPKRVTQIYERGSMR